MLSKTSALVLPATLLLLDFWPLKRLSQSPHLREKLPLGLCSLGVIIIGLNTQSTAPVDAIFRILTPAIVTFEYLLQFLFPSQSPAIYLRPDFWEPTWAILCLISILLITYICWRVRHRVPWLAFGWFWFLILGAAVSGLAPVGPHYRADRYTYLPGIGLGCMLLLPWLAQAKTFTPTFRFLLLGVGIWLVHFLINTCWMLPNWRNSETLFSSIHRHQSNNYVTSINLGRMAHIEGEFEQAIKLNRMAISTVRIATPYRNLGRLMEQIGKPAAACEYYYAATELNSNDAVSMHRLASLALETQPNRFAPSIVYYAQTACSLSNFRNPEFIDTLVDAFSFNAEYDQALDAARIGWHMATGESDWAAAESWEAKILALETQLSSAL